MGTNLTKKQHLATLKKTFFFFFPFLIFFTAFELGLRVYFDVIKESKAHHFIQDETFGWIPNKNLNQYGWDPDHKKEHLFKTDANGFRSSPPKLNFDGTRVVLLGDSLIWGIGVDQDKIASSVLGILLGKQFEVIVAAAPGWSTDQELLFLKKKVFPYKPDIVVWFICANNDIIQNIQDTGVQGVKYIKPRFKLNKNGEAYPVYPKKEIDRDLFEKLKTSVKKNYTLKLLKKVIFNIPFMKKSVYQRIENIENNTSHLNLYHKFPNKEFNKGLKITAALLKKGQKECVDRGMKIGYAKVEGSRKNNEDCLHSYARIQR